MLKHLASQHPTQSQRQQQGATSSEPKRHGPLDVFVKHTTCPAGRAGQLTSAIVGMVALRPVSIVNGVGFKRLMNVAEPGYSVPSKTHITTLLRKKHAEGRSRLTTALSSAVGLALTTDMWTSRAMEGYLTATVHFVNKDWKMCSLVLETAGFLQHHTAENIGKRLVDLANGFDITDRTPLTLGRPSFARLTGCKPVCATPWMWTRSRSCCCAPENWLVTSATAAKLRKR